ncbi:MAG TPA: hypothetical protein VM734_30100 [Kofleriaceae bacterium]|jgi:hypothetical protein|nr:hypothetical protein [Kofleriaceae bacterium]
MGDAYTPGLTVTRSTVVRKSRRLPLPGDVLRKVGDRVTSDDVVARTQLPGKVHLMNLATALGAMPDELAGKLLVKPGDPVKKGQSVAESKSFFGLFTSRALAPIDGTLESVSEVTGQAIFREPPVPVEVKAYVDGKVVEIHEGEGVVVETDAAMIQGIFGLAGEVVAPLVVVAKQAGQTLEASDLGPEHKGKVVVGGGRATLDAMRRAMDLKIAAVVCGGFAYQDVKELLGYDVGVAVTGTEQLATTLVVTEGFGDIAMASATFELLRSLEGRVASVCGATQIRAGVIRPEVVIPDAGKADDQAAAGGLEIGAPVRCIRAPYFGRIGKVSALPVELATMASETQVRVLEVDLGSERIMVPRANVEVIER